MKKAISSTSLVLLHSILLISQSFAQNNGLSQIDKTDLETHMTFLASDEMEGRKTGEPGLDKAAEYLAAQAREIGLKPVDENGDFYQNYTLVTKKMDTESSSITISEGTQAGTKFTAPFYVVNPDSDRMEINGEAVFAGYGIHSEQDGYNDFEGLDLEGKIVLIIDRGPMDESGEINLLSNRDWSTRFTIPQKIPALMRRGPKAILIVMDPRTGARSFTNYQPRMARAYSNSSYAKVFGERNKSRWPETAPKIIFIDREVADQMLETSGKSLQKLQNSIDKKLKPKSFELKNLKVNISAGYRWEEKPVPNVVGMIEGNDPQLKDEVIVYTAHFDHLGKSADGNVYNGADDNASGTVALIELGQAFMAEREKLKRSVMMLWVSGEEIGLYGSKYYTRYPIIPLENTVACINLDMIAAVRSERDTGYIHGERMSVQGMDSISLIGGHQSSELMEIHNTVSGNLGISTDLSLNDPYHPYRYYFRSDHINFARNNIPILFYSTGIHVDYHKVSDNYERINYTKLKKVSELSFLVGFELATMPERIKVDNPFSEWERTWR
ncbi:M28 family peptidase [Bacteroidota bacterium]